MNWYRHPYSESRYLLSLPNFNVFRWFFQGSMVQQHVLLNWNSVLLGWSGGAMVLGKLPVMGLPAYLD